MWLALISKHTVQICSLLRLKLTGHKQAGVSHHSCYIENNMNIIISLLARINISASLILTNEHPGLELSNFFSIYYLNKVVHCIANWSNLISLNQSSKWFFELNVLVANLLDSRPFSCCADLSELLSKYWYDINIKVSVYMIHKYEGFLLLMTVMSGPEGSYFIL